MSRASNIAARYSFVLYRNDRNPAYTVQRSKRRPWLWHLDVRGKVIQYFDSMAEANMYALTELRLNGVFKRV